MAKQLKGILFTTLAIIVFMIAMPIFIMKPKVSANQVEEITNSNESVEASTKQNNNIIIKGNETVKVYITETGKIEEVNLEDYICGVVSNEMPANFEKEALKAQAVAARTYLASKKLNSCTLDEGIDICDSTHCQVYTSKEKRLEKWDASYANEPLLKTGTLYRVLLWRLRTILPTLRKYRCHLCLNLTICQPMVPGLD